MQYCYIFQQNPYGFLNHIFWVNDQVNSDRLRESLEKIVGTDDSRFSGFDLATLIRNKYGKSYDVQLIKKVSFLQVELHERFMSLKYFRIRYNSLILYIFWR